MFLRIKSGKYELEAMLLQPTTSLFVLFPVVVFVHGWNGDSTKGERVRKLSAKLLEAGFACLLLNLPGHGCSSGKRVEFTVTIGSTALRSALNWIEDQPQLDRDNISVVAASIGASVAIHAAAYDSRIRRLVLHAPRTSFADTTAQTYAFNDGGKPVVNRAIRRSGLRIDFYKLARRIKAPTLISHGELDPYIHPDQSQRLFGSIGSPTRQLKICLGTGHMLGGKYLTEHVEEATDWLTKPHVVV
jgi:pimeloyl-ACP methyl ester carboxylesterase